MPSSPENLSLRNNTAVGGVLGMLCLIPCLFLVGAGLKASAAASAYTQPTFYTFAQFASRMPKEGWYTITGAEADVTKAVFWEENGVCIDVYAPLTPVVGHTGFDPDIYVELRDPRTLSALQDMKYAKRDQGEAGERRFVQEHRDVFLQRRDFSGLITFGHRDPIHEWADAGLDPAKITFIEDGWKPNRTLAGPGTMTGIVGCLICLGLVIRGFRGRRR